MRKVGAEGPGKRGTTDLLPNNSLLTSICLLVNKFVPVHRCLRSNKRLFTGRFLFVNKILLARQETKRPLVNSVLKAMITCSIQVCHLNKPN